MKTRGDADEIQTLAVLNGPQRSAGSPDAKGWLAQTRKRPFRLAHLGCYDIPELFAVVAALDAPASELARHATSGHMQEPDAYLAESEL